MGLIEEWRIREYEKGVYHLAQQREMRMAGHAVWGKQSSKMKSYDRVGTAEWIDRLGRYGDTPNLDIDHTRRNVVMKDKEFGKLIDNMDVLRNLNDPTSDYQVSISMGAKRKMDEVFRDAALGTAITGEDGDGSQVLPTARHIASVSAGAFDYLNIDTLRMAAYKFNTEEIDEEETRYLAYTSLQLMKMLQHTEVTSSDYNTIKALVDGKIDTFMGFKFIRTELLDTETEAVKYDLATGEYSAGGSSGLGGTRCIAWVKSGMRMMDGYGVKASVDKRTDKRNIPQLYNEMSLGGVRMEDVKILEINCKSTL